MTLVEIQERLAGLPTVMELDAEIALIRDLMRLDRNEITQNNRAFCSIIRALALSHTDTAYMLVTKDDEVQLIEFVNWLRQMRADSGLCISDHVLEDLTATPSDLERSLQKPRQ